MPRLLPIAVTPAQLAQRSWWSGPDIYLVIDDLELVGDEHLRDVVALLPHARDIGLHVVAARKFGGVSRALFGGFLGAMKAVSGKEGVAVPADATVTAQVGIGPRSEGGFGITADLTVALPGVPEADARRLVDAAHQVCPYSNATRGNVDVGLKLA